MLSHTRFQKTDRYRDCGRYKSVSAATVTVFGRFYVENENHRKIAVNAVADVTDAVTAAKLRYRLEHTEI
jgi:hypothetical protein